MNRLIWGTSPTVEIVMFSFATRPPEGLQRMRAVWITASYEAKGSPWLLHTYDQAPLLDAFLARLPTGATIDRVGVLAPFHQEDGAPPDGAILDRILDATDGRRGRGFVLDVGVCWEGNPVASSSEGSSNLDGHIGELWAVVDGLRGKETTSWFVLGKHVGHNFEVEDGRAGGSRSMREMNGLCAAGNAWQTGMLDAFAPEGLIDRAALRASLRLWLFPEVHRRDGRVSACRCTAS